MDVNTFLSHRRPVATPSGELTCTEFGTGPAALFVHGLGTSGLLWRQVIDEVSGTSRCIAVDLPAHGASPARDDMSVTVLAEALDGVCDSLGTGQVDLVGNDTGGAIAQVFAARRPGKIRTLTLTNCECEERAVEKHIANIFSKLGLAPSDADRNRVLAVLRYLGS